MQNSFFGSAIVAGTDATDTKYVGNTCGKKVKVAGVVLVPNVSVSLHASNYITISIKKGATTIATHTTNSSGGSALTAGTPVEMTLTGTGTDLEVADLGAFTVDVAKAGTGPTYSVSAVMELRELS